MSQPRSIASLFAKKSTPNSDRGSFSSNQSYVPPNQKMISQNSFLPENDNYNSKSDIVTEMFPIKSQVEPDFDRSQYERVSKSFRLPTINAQQPRYDIQSLCFFVQTLRRKITSRFSGSINPLIWYSDSDIMIRIQKKFTQIRPSWEKLMDMIIEQVTITDNKYMATNYFGFKDLLMTDILNISLSYIIIGKDTINGYGIDNVDGLNDRFDMLFENNSVVGLTIEQQITDFFEKMHFSLEKMILPFKSISESNKTHSAFLQQKATIVSNVQYLRSTIKVQEKELDELEKDNKKNKNKEPTELTPEEIDQMKQNLIINKSSLREGIAKQKEIDTNIDDIINLKKSNYAVLWKEYMSISKALHFNYFVHNEYCTSIDADIIPKDTSIISKQA